MELAEYIGIPYLERGRDRRGVDCYGLVYLFYRETLGIELPRYEGAPDCREREAIRRLISDQLELCEWKEIPQAEVRLGDLILTRYAGTTHAGISLGWPSYLHCNARGTTKEDLRRPVWNRRIEGCFRHSSLAA